MKKDIISIIILILCCVVATWFYYEEANPIVIERVVGEPIEVIKEIPIEIETIREVPRFIFVDRIEEHTIVKPSANATDDELSRAYSAIEYGREAHMQFVVCPWLQNEWTGGTEFNLMWVENYNLLRELLERAYK